jgi:hypothetical protein
MKGNYIKSLTAYDCVDNDDENGASLYLKLTDVISKLIEIDVCCCVDKAQLLLTDLINNLNAEQHKE